MAEERSRTSMTLSASANEDTDGTGEVLSRPSAYNSEGRAVTAEDCASGKDLYGEGRTRIGCFLHHLQNSIGSRYWTTMSFWSISCHSYRIKPGKITNIT